VLSVGLWLLGLWPRGVRNALQVRPVRIEVPVRGLPEAFDGYRILHLSDFHIDLVPGLDDAVVRALEGVEADIALMTGDYQGHYGEDVAHLRDPYSKIFAAIRAGDGIAGVMGNHDSAGVCDLLSSLGANMLINETITLQRGASEICVTGTDDVFFHWSPQAQDALAAAPAGLTKIALVHTSNLAEEAAARGFALYLTGHTHGGQICLPGGRPVLTMGMPRQWAAGLWKLGTMAGYTSKGIGTSCLPLRYNCQPEIALLTLRVA
jgi:predicted MPP superfamily phosphohydrolase